MNKSIVTYNRFILNSESHSITTEDHADILHGYLKRFSSVLYLKPSEVTEDAVLSELVTHRNNFYIGEMRRKIESSVFNCDSVKLKFVIAMLQNKAFVDDLENMATLSKTCYHQKQRGFSYEKRRCSLEVRTHNQYF
jgi:hypothetical protein